MYAINDGGGPAHVDTDADMDGNVCVAWFSDRRDGLLPMFRPYKFESNAEIKNLRSRKMLTTLPSLSYRIGLIRIRLAMAI